MGRFVTLTNSMGTPIGCYDSATGYTLPANSPLCNVKTSTGRGNMLSVNKATLMRTPINDDSFSNALEVAAGAAPMNPELVGQMDLLDPKVENQTYNNTSNNFPPVIEKKDNTLKYVGIGVAALAAIGIAVYAIKKMNK